MNNTTWLQNGIANKTGAPASEVQLTVLPTVATRLAAAQAAGPVVSLEFTSSSYDQNVQYSDAFLSLTRADLQSLNIENVTYASYTQAPASSNSSKAGIIVACVIVAIVLIAGIAFIVKKKLRQGELGSGNEMRAADVEYHTVK